MKVQALKLIMVLFLISAETVLFSCSAINGVNKTVPERKGVISAVRSWNDVEIELSFIPENILKQRFGEKNNPFISPISFLKSNRLRVFELKIANRGSREIVLYLNRVEIQFGGVNAKPYNRFQLENFWKPRLEKQPDYEKWNFSILRRVVEQNVIDNRVKIGKGRHIDGLVVFKGPFPDYGRAVVYIPLFSERNELIKIFEMKFEF